jgi:hypothetical protein
VLAVGALGSGALPGVCAETLNVALRATMPMAIERSVGKLAFFILSSPCERRGILNALK